MKGRRKENKGHIPRSSLKYETCIYPKAPPNGPARSPRPLRWAALSPPNPAIDQIAGHVLSSQQKNTSALMRQKNENHGESFYYQQAGKNDKTERERNAYATTPRQVIAPARYVLIEVKDYINGFSIK